MQKKIYSQTSQVGVSRSNSRADGPRPTVGARSNATQSAFVKCVVVGDGQVGKTCLLLRYCTNRFQGQHEYQPTIFENYQHTVEYEDTSVRLLLFDTAGQEDYDRVRQLAYPLTDVFVLCYSPFLASSYYNLEQRWLPELRRSCPGVPIVLVATQADLRRRTDIIEELVKDGEEIITLEQGITMAHELGAVGYLECSALTREGIDDVFKAAVEAVLKPNCRKLSAKRSRQSGCKVSNIFCCCTR